MDEWAEARERMVVAQLEARGIRHPGVLTAMRRVPRHRFVPAAVVASAYADRALPIDAGQTISQLYMVARMSEVLAGDRCLGRVLEVGTGSGYQAAVLSGLAREVITIERRPELARTARDRLRLLGFANVAVLDGDGTAGVEESAPYDGILVTAGAPHAPAALQAQLAENARLVIPLGSQFQQYLTVITRSNGRFEQRGGEGCVFVPLIGKDAWGPEKL